jgi:uncharacterized cupin superfamily protein
MTSTLTDRRYGVAEGLAMKAPVRVATTAAITLSGLQTIDDVTVVEDDRVLVRVQDDSVDNGIYVASSGNWSRAVDFDGSRDIVRGTIVYVLDGTEETGKAYRVSTTDSPIVFGTSDITFEIVHYIAATDEAVEISNSGKAIALSSAGSLVSETIVTPRAYQILRLRESDTGGRIVVEFATPHEFTEDETINVRVGGWHPSTWRRNPANGDWAITIPDAYSIDLTDSAWISTPYTLQETFLHGFAYVDGSLVDANPELKRLTEWAHDNGGGNIILPLGTMAMTTIDPDRNATGWYIPGGIHVTGQGRAGRSLIIVDDDLPAHPILIADGSNITLEHFSLDCNRSYATTSPAYHGIRLGQTTPIVDQERVVMRFIDVLGSKSYGIGWQGEGSYTYCGLDNCTIVNAGSDALDCKNRAAIGQNNFVTNSLFNIHAMFQLGTERAVAVALPADPFSTTNGDSIVEVTVALAADRPVAGGRVTFDTADAVAGLTLDDPDIGYDVVDTTGLTTFTIDAGSNANATTTGGGSSVTMKAPSVNEGDTAIDCRGHGMRVANNRIILEFINRTAITARPDSPGSDQVGSPRIAIVGNTILHQGYYSSNSTNGISVTGADGAAVTGNAIYGPAIGIQMPAQSAGAAVTGNFIENCGVAGIYALGVDATIVGNVIRDSAYGIRVGATEGTDYARAIVIADNVLKDCETSIRGETRIEPDTVLVTGNISDGHTVAAYDQAGSDELMIWGKDNIGGFPGVTAYDLGTITTGTVTPGAGDRDHQYYINGGAHTLAPGSIAGSYLLDITNNASAGAITTSGWTRVSGSSLTTVNGDKFRCHCSVGPGGSLLQIEALQ